MTQCLTCKSTFEEYEYKNVAWSGDSVSCCPVCGTSIYHGDFRIVQSK